MSGGNAYGEKNFDRQAMAPSIFANVGKVECNRFEAIFAKKLGCYDGSFVDEGLISMRNTIPCEALPPRGGETGRSVTKIILRVNKNSTKTHLREKARGC